MIGPSVADTPTFGSPRSTSIYDLRTSQSSLSQRTSPRIDPFLGSLPSYEKPSIFVASTSPHATRFSNDSEPAEGSAEDFPLASLSQSSKPSISSKSLISPKSPPRVSSKSAPKLPLMQLPKLATKAQNPPKSRFPLKRPLSTEILISPRHASSSFSGIGKPMSKRPGLVTMTGFFEDTAPPDSPGEFDPTVFPSTIKAEPRRQSKKERQWTVDDYPAAIRLTSEVSDQKRPLSDIRGLARILNNPTIDVPIYTESSTSVDLGNYFSKDVPKAVAGQNVVWTIAGVATANSAETVWGESTHPGLLHRTVVHLFEVIESYNQTTRKRDIEIPPLTQTEFVLSLCACHISGEERKDLLKSIDLDGIISQNDGHRPKLITPQDTNQWSLSTLLVSRLDQFLECIERLRKAVFRFRQESSSSAPVTNLASILFKGDGPQQILSSIGNHHLLIHITIDSKWSHLMKWKQSRCDYTQKLDEQVVYRTKDLRRGSLSIIEMARSDCLRFPECRSLAPSHFHILDLMFELCSRKCFSSSEDKLWSIISGSTLTEQLNALLWNSYKKPRLLNQLTTGRMMFHISMLSTDPILAVGFLRYCQIVTNEKKSRNFEDLLRYNILDTPKRSFFDLVIKREVGILPLQEVAPFSCFGKPLTPQGTIVTTTTQLAKDMKIHLAVDPYIIKPEGLSPELVAEIGRSLLVKMFRSTEKAKQEAADGEVSVGPPDDPWKASYALIANAAIMGQPPGSDLKTEFESLVEFKRKHRYQTVEYCKNIALDAATKSFHPQNYCARYRLQEPTVLSTPSPPILEPSSAIPESTPKVAKKSATKKVEESLGSSLRKLYSAEDALLLTKTKNISNSKRARTVRIVPAKETEVPPSVSSVSSVQSAPPLYQLTEPTKASLPLESSGKSVSVTVSPKLNMASSAFVHEDPQMLLSQSFSPFTQSPQDSIGFSLARTSISSDSKSLRLTSPRLMSMSPRLMSPHPMSPRSISRDSVSARSTSPRQWVDPGSVRRILVGSKGSPISVPAPPTQFDNSPDLNPSSFSRALHVPRPPRRPSSPFVSPKDTILPTNPELQFQHASQHYSMITDKQRIAIRRRRSDCPRSVRQNRKNHISGVGRLEPRTRRISPTLEADCESSCPGPHFHQDLKNNMQERSSSRLARKSFLHQKNISHHDTNSKSSKSSGSSPSFYDSADNASNSSSPSISGGSIQVFSRLSHSHTERSSCECSSCNCSSYQTQSISSVSVSDAASRTGVASSAAQSSCCVSYHFTSRDSISEIASLEDETENDATDIEEDEESLTQETASVDSDTSPEVVARSLTGSSWTSMSCSLSLETETETASADSSGNTVGMSSLRDLVYDSRGFKLFSPSSLHLASLGTPASPVANSAPPETMARRASWKSLGTDLLEAPQSSPLKTVFSKSPPAATPTHRESPSSSTSSDSNISQPSVKSGSSWETQTVETLKKRVSSNSSSQLDSDPLEGVARNLQKREYKSHQAKRKQNRKIRHMDSSAALKISPMKKSDLNSLSKLMRKAKACRFVEHLRRQGIPLNPCLVSDPEKLQAFICTGGVGGTDASDYDQNVRLSPGKVPVDTEALPRWDPFRFRQKAKDIAGIFAEETLAKAFAKHPNLYTKLHSRVQAVEEEEPCWCCVANKIVPLEECEKVPYRRPSTHHPKSDCAGCRRARSVKHRESSHRVSVEPPGYALGQIQSQALAKIDEATKNQLQTFTRSDDPAIQGSGFGSATRLGPTVAIGNTFPAKLAFNITVPTAGRDGSGDTDGARARRSREKSRERRRRELSKMLKEGLPLEGEGHLRCRLRRSGTRDASDPEIKAMQAKVSSSTDEEIRDLSHRLKRWHFNGYYGSKSDGQKQNATKRICDDDVNGVPKKTTSESKMDSVARKFRDSTKSKGNSNSVASSSRSNGDSHSSRSSSSDLKEAAKNKKDEKTRGHANLKEGKITDDSDSVFDKEEVVPKSSRITGVNPLNHPLASALGVPPQETLPEGYRPRRPFACIAQIPSDSSDDKYAEDRAQSRTKKFGREKTEELRAMLKYFSGPDYFGAEYAEKLRRHVEDIERKVAERSSTLKEKHRARALVLARVRMDQSAATTKFLAQSRYRRSILKYHEDPPESSDDHADLFSMTESEEATLSSSHETDPYAPPRRHRMEELRRKNQEVASVPLPEQKGRTPKLFKTKEEKALESLLAKYKDQTKKEHQSSIDKNDQMKENSKQKVSVDVATEIGKTNSSQRNLMMEMAVQTDDESRCYIDSFPASGQGESYPMTRSEMSRSEMTTSMSPRSQGVTSKASSVANGAIESKLMVTKGINEPTTSMLKAKLVSVGRVINPMIDLRKIETIKRLEEAKKLETARKLGTFPKLHELSRHHSVGIQDRTSLSYTIPKVVSGATGQQMGSPRRTKSPLNLTGMIPTPLNLPANLPLNTSPASSPGLNLTAPSPLGVTLQPLPPGGGPMGSPRLGLTRTASLVKVTPLNSKIRINKAMDT